MRRAGGQCVFPMKFQSRNLSAFTLLELLVSLTITAVLLALMVQMISTTQKVWTRTKAQAEAFRGARAAFESMTRQIAQATVNSYWDYDDPTAPKFYVRQSELHFVCGPTETLIGKNQQMAGHGLFFQAPFGFSNVPVTAPSAGLDQLLNCWGYFVKYDSDKQQRPDFLNDKAQQNLHPDMKRFRLMEFRQSADQLTIFHLDHPAASTPPVMPSPLLSDAKSEADLYAWFRSPISTASQPLADNILAVLIQPQLPTTTPPLPTPTDFVYNTRAHQLIPSKQPVTARAAQSRHQLPPVLKLTLIALEENSWSRLSTAEADKTAAELLILLNKKIFQTPSKYDADMRTLESALTARNIQHRVFTTAIAIRAAKWVSAREQ